MLDVSSCHICVEEVDSFVIAVFHLSIGFEQFRLGLILNKSSLKSIFLIEIAKQVL